MLGSEDAALEVDRHAALERLLGEVEQLGVAASEADPNVVVQDVDAAPPGARIFNHRLELGVLGDVGPECYCRTLLGPGHVDGHIDGLLGRFEVVIDAQHASTLASESQRCGAAVAHALAGALAGANDDSDAILRNRMR